MIMNKDSIVLYIFAANKPFGILLEVFLKNHIFVKHLIQNLELLKYGLQIDIVNHQKQKTEKI